MKEQNIRVSKRRFSLTKQAHWFLQELIAPQTEMPPLTCKFCGSIHTIQRANLFECLDCESFLGKTKS